MKSVKDDWQGEKKQQDRLTLEDRKYRLMLRSIAPAATVARLPDATAVKLAILDSSVLTAFTFQTKLHKSLAIARAFRIKRYLLLRKPALNRTLKIYVIT